MRNITVTVGPLTSGVATAVAAAQTPGAAGNLTINGSLASGGVATMDTARRILITTVSDESAKTLTLYGTDWNGNLVSEVITGPNATTAQSVMDYKTVTRVAVSAAFTGNVSVGTNGVASSRWVSLDNYGWAQIALQCDVTGTANGTVSQTVDDVLNLSSPYLAKWVNHPDTNLVGFTANVQGNYAAMPSFVRVTLNSGSGSISMNVLQAGPLAN